MARIKRLPSLDARRREQEQQHEEKNVNQQQQQEKKNVNQQQKHKNVKKNSQKREKRPCPPACRREQQQRDPQGWLLELVAEFGGMGPPAFLCTKRLTISDTNRNLNRFAVPRNIVYDVLFPLMEDDEQKEVCSTGGRFGGGGLRVQGHDGMGPLSLCFKFWESNLMFLFNDGWKFIVEWNDLRPDKDVVEWWCFRDASMALHFAFCIVKGEEEGIVIGGEEEGRSKNNEENGVVADRAAVLEGVVMCAMNDDSRVSVVEEKEEEENEHCHFWVHKKRRIIYT